MATIRVDVTGNGVDYSKTVEVDEGKEISSIKIDNGSNEVKVNYKKSVGDGDGRKEVSNEEDSNAASNVVSEEAGSEPDVDASDGVDVKLKARGKAESGTGPKAKVDPDGNTAKVKTDETLPNA